MTDHPPALCSDMEIAALTAAIARDEARGTAMLREAVARHGGDARLRFLLGSVQASAGDIRAACAELRQAVDLDPSYAIARFQLGLLLLTSGRAEEAETIWRPLLAAADDDPLRWFVEGLGLVIRDRFAVALPLLDRGMALNTRNAPLNRDIALLAEALRKALAGGGTDARDPESGALSATHLLLQQAALRSTRH